jgi:GTP pyrophosphokinase
MSKHAKRVIRARWTNGEKIAFVTHINLQGIDDIGVVNSITKIISEELNVNMQKLSFNSHDGIFDGKISVFVSNTNHLDELMTKLGNVKGIISINRIESVESESVK